MTSIQSTKELARCNVPFFFLDKLLCISWANGPVSGPARKRLLVGSR